jgi:hypothetical protein
MVTGSELSAYQGRWGNCFLDNGLHIYVVVEEARTVYGRLQFYISPIAGGGKCWVNADRVTLSDNPQPSVRG